MHVLLTESSFGGADFLVRHLREACCPLDEPFAQPDLLVDVRGQGPELIDGLPATCRAASRHLGG